MTPADARKTDRHEAPATGRIGRLAVILMVGLGAVLALFGIVHQRSQTIRCLRFLGASAARRVAAANHVELLRLQPGRRPGVLLAAERLDISAARGLVHLRRGLVEDANYDWEGRIPDGPAATERAGRLPATAWAWGIAFAESPRELDAGAAAILAFAPGETGRGEPGWMTLVGGAGRVRLGRIERGLSAWIEGVLSGSAPDTSSAGHRVGLERIGKEGERGP